MLCKRKYKVVHDEEVAVAMLYSRVEADFFDGCARNGYSFADAQAGVRNCNHHSTDLGRSMCYGMECFSGSYGT